MLGIVHTYIHCNVTSCKYNNKGYCDPPDDTDGWDSKSITVSMGRCTTYKSKKAPKPQRCRGKK